MHGTQHNPVLARKHINRIYDTYCHDVLQWVFSYAVIQMVNNCVTGHDNSCSAISFYLLTFVIMLVEEEMPRDMCVSSQEIFFKPSLCR